MMLNTFYQPLHQAKPRIYAGGEPTSSGTSRLCRKMWVLYII